MPAKILPSKPLRFLGRVFLLIQYDQPQAVIDAVRELAGKCLLPGP